MGTTEIGPDLRLPAEEGKLQIFFLIAKIINFHFFLEIALSGKSK